MKFVAVVSTLLIASASAFAPASTSEVCVNFSIFNFHQKCRHVERIQAKKTIESRGTEGFGMSHPPERFVVSSTVLWSHKNEQIPPHTNVISFFIY